MQVGCRREGVPPGAGECVRDGRCLPGRQAPAQWLGSSASGAHLLPVAIPPRVRLCDAVAACAELNWYPFPTVKRSLVPHSAASFPLRCPPSELLWCSIQSSMGH